LFLIVILYMTDAKSVVASASEVQSRQSTDKDFNIHSRQYQSTLITNESDTHGACYYKTTENIICLPDFEEWRNIARLVHHPEIDTDGQRLGQSIIRYLDKHSHSRKRCDKSPDTCDWSRAGGDVEDYLIRLTKQVEEICSLFATKELMDTGSSAEKRNIFWASEFDHLAILENFRQSPCYENQHRYRDRSQSCQPLVWHASNKDAKSDVVLVLQRTGVGSQWRLSYPILERNMLLGVDASVTRVCQLLKFLAALHFSKDNLKREIPRKNPV
jgi:hypothetical protein